MRTSRDRWVFLDNPARKVLTPAEVAYWRTSLGNILKVGMEFEFNLPEKKGSCNGKSATCPCTKMEGSKCWKTCSNEELCKTNSGKSTCKGAADCKKKSCEDCDAFEFKCLGLGCSIFTTNCDNCQDFMADCKKCEYRLDPEKDPETIRKRLRDDLKPTETYGHLGSNGIHSIVTDGSLLGGKGAEVITTGRRTNYWEFYSMAKKIIDDTMRRGGYVNERCSIHMHVLAAYYGQMGAPGENSSKITEMEKNLPEIVLANYHQLCRRYQNALTWMTIGLDNPDQMTRWEKFRVSILDISAMTDKMSQVGYKVERNSGGNKYGWINYKYTQFAKNGDVNRLHVELRAMDGLMAPSVVASMACLYHAMMIKAVEISRYGVLEVGDDEWMANAHNAKNAILNNMKNYGDGDRWGDTTKTMKYENTYVHEALELVHQLKHALMKLGPPSFDVLEKLAERPIALLRCEGMKWDEVENYYKVVASEETPLSPIINEYIDCRIIDECVSSEEWTLAVVGNLAQEPSVAKLEMNEQEISEQVTSFITNRITDGEIIWSQRLGAMVKI